jgi:hypothetical protein
MTLMVNKFHYMVISHSEHYNKCNLNNTLEIEHIGNKFSFELLTFDLNVALNLKVWMYLWIIKFEFEIEKWKL